MADNEPAIIYRFQPSEDGAFLRGVPQRDLTQTDVDNMTGQERRDAFSPHPVHGKPLYKAVHPSKVPDFSKVHDEPFVVMQGEPPVPVEVERTPPPASIEAKKDGEA